MIDPLETPEMKTGLRVIAAAFVLAAFCGFMAACGKKVDAHQSEVQSREASVYVEPKVTEIRLDDGTRCVVLLKAASGGHYFGQGIACEWRR